MNAPALALPAGYRLTPCELVVDGFRALVLRFEGADVGRGFLSPPSQFDIDVAVDVHRNPPENPTGHRDDRGAYLRAKGIG